MRNKKFFWVEFCCTRSRAEGGVAGEGVNEREMGWDNEEGKKTRFLTLTK